MPENDSIASLFDRLMAMNREVFAAGQYEIAYHTLMAALHCAEVLRDEDRLGEVERVAGEQQEEIDRHAPGHRLSSQEAQKRGFQGIFGMAARQASAYTAIVQREHRRAGP